MAQTITIQYQLKPPAGPTYTMPAEKRREWVLPSGDDYYAMLREALAKARDEIGQELTSWRDAVGKAEANKEGATKRDEDDEEDEDQDLE
ncbi:hypothetical protein MKEN_00815300 [Mycena kentingensis (nom. inval.)]|nr:hypothetical protein MKEN_00815300 [Mycena kentingensis (nom. inval.)]